MPSITVYSKPADYIPKCYPCESTKKWLDKYGVEYEVKDLTTDENTEFAKSLGHQQAPVVYVQNDDGTTESWSGFNPPRLSALVK
jgi:glutaredoxin-like protein NrdH